MDFPQFKITAISYSGNREEVSVPPIKVTVLKARGSNTDYGNLCCGNSENGIDHSISFKMLQRQVEHDSQHLPSQQQSLRMFLKHPQAAREITMTRRRPTAMVIMFIADRNR